MYKFNPFLLFVLCIFLMPVFVLAQGEENKRYQPKSVEEIRAQYNLLVELRNNNHISDSIFEEKIESLKELSLTKFGVDLGKSDLKPLVPAKKLDWIGTALYVFSAGLIIVLFVPFLKRLSPSIVKLLHMFINARLVLIISKAVREFIVKFWEGIVYSVICLLLFLFSHEYVILFCSIALGSIIPYSFISRYKNPDNPNVIRLISSTLTILWATISIYFDNHFVGFLAITAFISSLGFVILPSPQVISIGLCLQNKLFIPWITSLTFLLSVIAWWFYYTDYLAFFDPLRQFLSVFRIGMASLMPLVFYVGSCYLAFFCFRDKPTTKLITEVLAFVGGLILLLLSLFYGIKSMFTISCLFMLWHLSDKFYELVYKKVDIVIAGIILAILLGVFGYLVKTNIEFIVSLLTPVLGDLG